jgi:hypothetical protein
MSMPEAKLKNIWFGKAKNHVLKLFKQALSHAEKREKIRGRAGAL